MNQQLLMIGIISTIAKQLTPEQAQAAAAELSQQAEAKAESDRAEAAFLKTVADSIVTLIAKL